MSYDEKHLEILADHYKDTHEIIRSREDRRDRLFLASVALLGLVALTVLFPSEMQNAVKEVDAEDVKINLAAIPLAVIASIAWTLLAATTLRCYQSVVTIDRQYNYLHGLEGRLAPEFDSEG